MADMLRESAFGQLVRLVTRNAYFRYPEEQDGFTCPSTYTDGLPSSGDETPSKELDAITPGSAAESNPAVEETVPDSVVQDQDRDLEKVETRSGSSSLLCARKSNWHIGTPADPNSRLYSRSIRHRAGPGGREDQIEGNCACENFRQYDTC